MAKAKRIKESVADNATNEAKKMLDPTEMIQQEYGKCGRISIKPYIKRDGSSIGLEEYGLRMFPQAVHIEPITSFRRNNKQFYMTGLDEFAPEIQNLKDEERKKAIIKDIRTRVAHLEKMTNSNVLDIEDPDFWSKVLTFRPDNEEYWDGITIKLDNEERYLNPVESIDDFVLCCIIEAGGFSWIAPSYEDALSGKKRYEFFLNKEYNTAKVSVAPKKLRNKAIKVLDNLSPDKAFFMAKVLYIDGYKIRFATSDDTIYSILDDIIQDFDMDSNKDANDFLKLSEEPIENIRMRAIVRDAIYANKITPKASGMYFDVATQTMLGKNMAEIETFLLNPMNEDIAIRLEQEIEEFWNVRGYE